MTMKLSAVIALAFLTATSGQAFAGAYGKSYTSTSGTAMTAVSSQVLTDKNGMTLYVFDKDAKGVSNCNGDCADNWPPFATKADAKANAKAKDGFSIISRKDGSLQWAKDGAPLYYWVGDSAPGDTNGDGIGGVWHLAH